MFGDNEAGEAAVLHVSNRRRCCSECGKDQIIPANAPALFNMKKKILKSTNVIHLYLAVLASFNCPVIGGASRQHWTVSLLKKFQHMRGD